jgi:hypothetical protein
MSKKKENELVETVTTEVVNQEAMLNEWGEVPLDSQDIIIPKLVLMQGQSTFVTDGLCHFGDVVETPSKEVMLKCSAGETICLIPFHHTTVWRKYKITNGKQEFLGYEDCITGKDKEYEENHGTHVIKNMRTINVFFINPKRPELPVVISFKGMSQRTGKGILTQIYVKNRQAGKVPCAYVLDLGAVKSKNDKGVFFVWEFKVGKSVTNDEVRNCLQWLKTIKKNPQEYKVDTSSDEDTGTTSVPEVNTDF